MSNKGASFLAFLIVVLVSLAGNAAAQTPQ